MNGLYQIPGLFLTALCHVIVVYYMAEHKYSKRRFMLYGCLYIAVFVSMGSYGYAIGGMAAILSYTGIVIFLFLFSCAVSRDCFFKKSFLFMTYFCLFTTLDNVLKLAVQLLFPRFSAPAGYYVVIILRSVVLLLILTLYKRYAVAILHSLSDYSGRSWWKLALSTLLFYLLQAVLTVLNELSAMPKAYLLLLFSVVSSIMCVVYGVIFSNISYMKKDAETALVRQNAEYLFARLSALQDAEETYRRLRHDMRHHLETIAEYAKAGDTSAVLDYIKDYSIEVSETAVKPYSVNRTVNNILSVYAGKAAENGIVYSVKCNAPVKLTVRDIDLIALLGNLLENALHGCSRSGKEKTCIEILIRVQNSRLIIVCDNTCSDDLSLSGSLPAGKSIGISSILAVCRKYDGNLDYKVENGICSACAVLNL